VHQQETERAVARSYYSTVFTQPAGEIWAVLRDFGNYTIWVDGVDESRIEEGKSGDAVGAIRNIRMGETLVRQRLLAHSDRDRFYSYEFCEPFRFPVQNFIATIRVTPIVDGERSFIEWWVTFDCAAEQLARSFAGWLESLRRHLADRMPAAA
jgi:Polyketide cyclase / dehydrase and lipid transport